MADLDAIDWMVIVAGTVAIGLTVIWLVQQNQPSATAATE